MPSNDSYMTIWNLRTVNASIKLSGNLISPKEHGVEEEKRRGVSKGDARGVG